MLYLATSETYPFLNHVRIDVVKMDFNNNYAKFRILFETVDDLQFKEEYYELTQEDYSSWGLDDSYVIGKIFTEFSLSEPE